MSEFEELKQKYNNEMQKYVDAAAQNTENEELQASHPLTAYSK